VVEETKPSAARTEPKRAMSGGRLALLTVAILTVLVALSALIAGTVLLVVNHTERDSSGFFSTSREPLTTNSYAIVSDKLDVGTSGPDWLFQEGRLATIRVQGRNQDPARELFIGVAPAAQVDRYLAGTRYATITDLSFNPFRATYRSSAGSSAPAPPGDKTFWTAATSGAGSRTLEWDVAKGNWSVVVMNADGSPSVNAQLSVGADVGFILWLGLALVIAGALLLAISASLTFLSLRPPRVSAAPTPQPA
jgi:hypothetical protein